METRIKVLILGRGPIGRNDLNQPLVVVAYSAMDMSQVGAKASNFLETS